MVAVSLNRFVVARMILIRNRWKERKIEKDKRPKRNRKSYFCSGLTFGFRKKQINTYHGMYVETYKVI